MYFELSTEQELLRHATARHIAAVGGTSVGRDLYEPGGALPPGYLRRAGELGWFAMLVPESRGGGSISGSGLHDLCIIAHERGRWLQPGPFIGTNIVAAALSDARVSGRRSRVLLDLIKGEKTGAWVPDDNITGLPRETSLTLTNKGDGYSLSGEASYAESAQVADYLLVSTTSNGAQLEFLLESRTAGVSIEPVGCLDPSLRLACVSFDDVQLPHETLVERTGSLDGTDRQFDIACTLIVAEAVGAMDALFEMTRQYALDRIAFARPIGSFQAIKHLLADMGLALEASKAIATAAIDAVADYTQDAPETVSIAKSWVADAGIDIAQGCAQIFAGIGFTWEHDLHLFLRRLTTNGLLFGSAEWHRERICRLHGL